MLCEYGCGQEAKYFFPTVGIHCCSDHWSRCPIKKEKFSISHKGIKRSVESVRKQANSIRGRKISDEHKKKISEANKGKRRDVELIEYMRALNKGRVPWNKGKKGVYSQETLIKMSESKRLDLSSIKQKYPFFCKVEEIREIKGGVQVRCTNSECRKWFYPTWVQLYERIRNLERDHGNGGSYFYCSKECSSTCPLYKLRTDYALREDNQTRYYTDAELKVWRGEVLERDNYICQYCGNRAIEVHHIKPRKTEPFFSLDPDYGISCCSECHQEYAHRDECSTRNLAIMNC